VLKELMAIGGELRKGARTIKEIVQFNDEELNHQNVAPARPEHGSAHAGYSNPQVIAIMQSSTGTSGETASFTIRRRCIGWRLGGIYRDFCRTTSARHSNAFKLQNWRSKGSEPSRRHSSCVGRWPPLVLVCEEHLRSKGIKMVNQDVDQFPRDKTSSTPSEIFDVLWAALVEILGSPATATLLRRSAKRRLGDFPELGKLAITRKGFEYAYAVPADWKHANERSNPALQALVQDVCSLLLELTGQVVLHRLRALPQLAKFDLSLSEDR